MIILYFGITRNT